MTGACQRVAIITGGSQGVGASLVAAYRRRDWAVVANSRTSKPSEDGAVTACGLAQDVQLPTTVLPFILRGVSLLGINSVDAPAALRRQAWDLLAAELDPRLLAGVTRTVGLEDAIALGPDVLAGAVHGRTIVDVHR